MAYTAREVDLFQRTAAYIDRIPGAKPAELPMERPMRFELVINLKTAEALGLTIPRSSSSRRPTCSADAATPDVLTAKGVLRVKPSKSRGHDLRTLHQQDIPARARPFIHLDVEACFRTVPWSIPECLIQVTTKGRPRLAYLRRNICSRRQAFAVMSLRMQTLSWSHRTPAQGRETWRPAGPAAACARHRPRLLDELTSAPGVRAVASRHVHVAALCPRAGSGRRISPAVSRHCRCGCASSIPLADPGLRHQASAFINALGRAADLHRSSRRIIIMPAVPSPLPSSPSMAYHARAGITHGRSWTYGLSLPQGVYGLAAICAILAPPADLDERGNPFTAAGVKASTHTPSREVIIDDPWGQMTEKPRNFRFSVAGNLRPGLEGGLLG